MDLFLDDYLSIIILIISIINTIILSYLLFISLQSSPARYNTSTSTTSLRKLRFNLPPLSRYESIQDTRIPDTRYSEIICPEPNCPDFPPPPPPLQSSYNPLYEVPREVEAEIVTEAEIHTEVPGRLEELEAASEVVINRISLIEKRLKRIEKN